MKILKLTIILLFIPVGLLAVFTSSKTYTFTASVVLTGDVEKPIIKHTPLIRISPITKIGFIVAEISDNIIIDKVEIHYKTSTDINWSTKTITPGTTHYVLKEQIPQELLSEKNTFYYRISVTDGRNTTRHPFAAPWHVVSVNRSVLQKIISASGGEIILPDGNPFDGETSIIIPPNAVSGSHNIEIIEYSSAEVYPGNRPAISAMPITVYRFLPENLQFRSFLTVNLLYPDVDNDDVVDGTEFKEEKLSIFRYDGYEWRNLGSEIDEEKNLCTTRISGFSFYAVFPAGDISTDDYRPKERIITPIPRDGKNDKLFFDGINHLDIEIKIFDLHGRVIKTIKDPPYEWDGTDEDGKIMETGPYIYQFKVPKIDKYINGVVVIAR